jgi:nucleotide-binding universal stress UspA family protein
MDPSTTRTTVLVGVDGSAGADEAAEQAAARGADLVVLRAFDRPATGVVGLPPELDGPHHGVVVGIDGGPGSAELLSAAAHAPGLRDTGLRVLHTWPQLTEDVGLPVRWLLDPRPTTTEQAAVAALVDGLQVHSPGRTVAATVVAGRAGPVLVQASCTAELVVVGRPELAADQETRATTRQVSHRAACPVVVVPLPATATVPVPA